jgi:DNA invertase Pin-like site-specific DNA recombinase
MSTDLQKYSTENQLHTIRRYAEQRGFTIVRVFEDSGRSGLRMDGRDGLQSLMLEVQSGAAGFQAILVYDVSRWGRFQDADEGAYHEHVCSRAGIRVHYCGEQFDNDGSIGSILLKNVKRVMAGEYSRELSVKVFAGQCRLIEHGFRQGGPAGFGLRRLLIDEGRNPKGELGRGDRKSLQTDRVVLTLGPPDEIEHVHSIYAMFVEDRKSEREIALELNRRGILSDLGRPWTRASIHQILTNEKYIGNNIFNRVSYKLKQRRVVNHRDTWVRVTLWNILKKYFPRIRPAGGVICPKRFTESVNGQFSHICYWRYSRLLRQIRVPHCSVRIVERGGRRTLCFHRRLRRSRTGHPRGDRLHDSEPASRSGTLHLSPRQS